MREIAYFIHMAFNVYVILLFINIVGSWFPNMARYSFMRFVWKCTNPFLNLFRRWIPPIGGTLDLSPLLAFFSLQILEKIILALLLR
jgi:YggT family protein